jgi:group I intron endonuclease
MSYIYKTTNLLKGKIYIGQKTGVFDPLYYGSGLNLNRAIRKYGEKNFNISVIGFAETKSELNLLEIHFIAEYRKIYGKENVYNIADGGSGGHTWQGEHPWKGRRHTKKSKDMMSKARKGVSFSEEHKAKIANALTGKPSGMLGKKHSRETIKKMINNHPDFSGKNHPCFGIKRSEETKERQRVARLNWLRKHGTKKT